MIMYNISLNSSVKFHLERPSDFRTLARASRILHQVCYSSRDCTQGRWVTYYINTIENSHEATSFQQLMPFGIYSG